MNNLIRHIIIIIAITVSNTYAQPNKVNRLLKKEKYEKALNYGNEKIKQLQTDSNTSRFILKYYLTVARAYASKNDFVQAQKNLKEALNVVHCRKKSGKWMSIDDYNIMDELSILKLKNGDYIGARKLIDQSLSLRQNRWDKNNPTNYRPYFALGLYHYRLNNLDSAKFYIKSYQKNIRNSNYTASLEINRYADNYDLLSKIELKNNHLFKALHYAKKNKRLQNHYWTKIESGRNSRKKTLARISLSRVYTKLGLDKKAYKQNEKANKILQKKFVTDHQLNYKYHLNNGLIYYIRNEPDSTLNELCLSAKLAWEYTKNGLTTLSEYEKENFLEDIRNDIDLIHSLIYTLKSKNCFLNNDPRLLKIYQLTINTRSLVLDETSKFIQLMSSNEHKDLSKQFNKWKEAKDLVSILTTKGKSKSHVKQLEEAQTRLINIEKEITLLTKNETKQVSIDSLSKSLIKNQFAIQILKTKVFSKHTILDKSKIPFWQLRKKYTPYQRSDSNLYVFIVINGDSIKTKSLVMTDELENKFLLKYSNSIKYRVSDDKSYSRFAKTIFDSIPIGSTIYLATDGIYNLINLNSLQTSKESYLIDNYNLVNVTSIKEVIKKDTKPYYKSALLIGNPDFSHFQNSNKLPQLPGAEQEVRSIQLLLNKINLENSVVLNEKATEQSIKSAGNYSILHIATHGFFQSNGYKNPMFNSGLIFARSFENDSNKTDNGILTAYELSSISLKNTELVILSACESGVGKVKDGEGIYGLQRSLQLAGVNHIIMSFWKVDDEATQYLMTNFYSELIESNDPKLSFLSAQLIVRKKYPHPYYWASFKLIGK